MQKNLSPAERIVATMNRLYHHGMTTVSGGNLSIMDQEGNLWISPSGVDKGGLQVEDIMQITPAGEIIGRNRPSIEYPFHLSVRKVRPELRAVLHAHPSSLMAFSMMRIIPNLDLLPEAAALCKKITYAPYAVPGSIKLGELISAEFAKGYDVVMLENHGVAIGAPTLEEAFRMFEALDAAARIHVAIATIGKDPRKAPAPKALLTASLTAGEMPANAPAEGEQALREEIANLSRRGYQLGLLTSVSAVYSARLEQDTQIITPNGFDPFEQDADALLTVTGADAKRAPSAYAEFCALAYEKYPQINSIMITRAPNAMAYAHTAERFDTSILPESYAILKNVSVLPRGILQEDPEKALQTLSAKNPVALISNDCLVAMGVSPLSAYDRMEVLEYSAKALIACAAVQSPIISLTPEQLVEVAKAFNL